MMEIYGQFNANIMMIFIKMFYEEVSTFWCTEREKTFKNLNHRIISSTALDVSKKISNVHKHKLGYLTYSEFSQLGHDEFGSYHALLKNQNINLNNIKPREHQEVALEKGIRHFSLETRGKLVILVSWKKFNWILAFSIFKCE